MFPACQVLQAVADLSRLEDKRPAIPEGVKPEIEVRTETY
jgi:hypothetical protein